MTENNTGHDEVALSLLLSKWASNFHTILCDVTRGMMLFLLIQSSEDLDDETQGEDSNVKGQIDRLINDYKHALNKPQGTPGHLWYSEILQLHVHVQGSAATRTTHITPCCSAERNPYNKRASWTELSLFWKRFVQKAFESPIYS